MRALVLLVIMVRGIVVALGNASQGYHIWCAAQEQDFLGKKTLTCFT